MGFAPQARIDLGALRHNLSQVRRHAPHSEVLAVVKANAYGHGVASVVSALQGADGFAVARIDEALALRRLGVDKPILVMSGAYQAEDILQAVEHRLRLAVHHVSQLDLLQQLRPQGLECWIKVDSGMRRLGFLPQQVAGAVQQLRDLGLIAAQPVFMTHMACADEPNHPLNQQQWGCFHDLLQQHGARFSAANSAGLMTDTALQGDWVRPGIMLYGVSPLLDQEGPQLELRPVMTLEARLLSVKQCQQGESVGYGAGWRCPEAMPLGVVGIGYGDGYPRHAPPGTPVWINGSTVPLVGRVSMDMITVDLRSQPSAQVGDRVVLWGEGLPAERIASAAGTIAYQLFCNVTARVGFYTVDGQE